MGMNDKHDYEPTKWVDNSEPDIDAEHLNKIESALQEYGVSIDELAAAGGTAAKVKATDTYGLVVSALGESTAQALIDAIANKVMNELINKNKIVNNLLATDDSTVLAGTQGAALDKRLVAAENAVTQLNSDVELWNGTLSSGQSLTVPGISKYRAIYATIQGYKRVMFLSDTQSGFCGASAEGAQLSMSRLDISGDTVTFSGMTINFNPDGSVSDTVIPECTRISGYLTK